MNRKKGIRKDKSKKDQAQEKSRGVVTVPYVHSFTEKIQRIFTKHSVATVVKPQTTLRQVLVHPKDKVEKQKKAGVVYKIPCSQCEKVYISVKQGDSWEPGSQNTERKQKRSFWQKFHKIHTHEVWHHGLTDRRPITSRLDLPIMAITEFNTISWRDITHFDSEDDYRGGLSKRLSLSTTTVLFRNTFTRTIILNLLMKNQMGNIYVADTSVCNTNLHRGLKKKNNTNTT